MGVVEGADPYRGLGGIVSRQSVGEGPAPAIFDERFFSYIMDRRGSRCGSVTPRL